MPKKARSYNQPQRRGVSTRASAAKRGYGRRHCKEREAYLYSHPVCEWPGCSALATVLDHVIPLRVLSEAENTERQALCAKHHAEKTKQDKALYPDHYRGALH